MGAGDALAALLARPLGQTLDDIAGQQVAAAGGTSAALTGALAAALTCKVGRAARTTWDDAGGAIAQGDALRTRLVALAATDAEAYAHARALLRRAGQDREHRGMATAPGLAPLDPEARDRELGEALEIAAAAPLAIAEAAAEVADLAAQAAENGGADERADAVVAASLAAAAAAGAAQLVLVNLAIRDHDEWAQRARDAASAAERSRDRAVATS